MDTRHEYIFSTVSKKLGMEQSEIEDCVLEGSQVRIF